MKKDLSFKNIRNLSSLFIKDNFNKIDIIKDNKFNKKSMWFWVILILIFGLTYLSSEIIDYLIKIGQPQIFISGYSLALNIILIIQAILLTVNIFYFSKDLENILPMPFKPIEIIIAKFNSLICFLYGTLIIFAFVPFFIYGIDVNMGIFYFIKLILGLFFLPIFPTLIITISTMILMNFIKRIKNKDLIQIIITLFLVISLFFALFFIFSKIINLQINEQNIEVANELNYKIKNINKYFITINPIINILEKNNLINNLFNCIYLILINLFLFYIFIFIGKKLYLKQILRISFYFKNKKNKKINLNKKCKKNKIYKSYIKKEFNNIIKNPLYFIQCIYPTIIMTFSISIILMLLITKLKNVGYEQNWFEGLSFDFEALILIVGGIQILGLFNKTTITAISREGKDAYTLKYLPIDLYKQFIYKNIPQVLINSIFGMIVLLVLYFCVEALELKYIIYIFIITFILFLINSYLLLIINLLNPKNKWDSEYEVFKNNKNILLQYLLIIFNIIFLYYFDKLFYKHNLDKSINLFIFILLFIFIILNILINKFKNKLFEKIN